MESNLLKAPLSQEIQKQYSRLINSVIPLSASSRILRELEGTGGKVSVADLIAYQIGWGRCVIQWNEAGIKGEKPVMPCEGFSGWDYVGIAEHFYMKNRYDGFREQERDFHATVLQILNIVEKEYLSGNLDREGVWAWCTLQSGKQWPLLKLTPLRLINELLHR